MTDPAFITNLKNQTDHFLQKLLERKKSGKKLANIPVKRF
jgi:hypothetical protein